MEARFADESFARKVYGTVVRRIIDCGVRLAILHASISQLMHVSQTTTCCYYGTLHLEATKILAEFVHTAGKPLVCPF